MLINEHVLFKAVGQRYVQFVSVLAVKNIFSREGDYCPSGCIVHQGINEFRAVTGSCRGCSHNPQRDPRVGVPFPRTAIVTFADLAQLSPNVTNGSVVGTHLRDESSWHREVAFVVLRMRTE